MGLFGKSKKAKGSTEPFVIDPPGTSAVVPEGVNPMFSKFYADALAVLREQKLLGLRGQCYLLAETPASVAEMLDKNILTAPPV